MIAMNVGAIDKRLTKLTDKLTRLNTRLSKYDSLVARRDDIAADIDKLNKIKSVLGVDVVADA